MQFKTAGFFISNPMDQTPLGKIPETLTFTGELVMAEQDKARFEAWAEAMQARELARIKALAAASGLSVVYDTTAFELAWSPQYDAAGSVQGWFNNTTDEFRAGADYPGEDR